MKIRQGFVSNSSSSSFVLHGYCIKKMELANILGITEEEARLKQEEEEYSDVNTALFDILWEKIYNKDRLCKNFLKIADTREFFDGEPTDDIVVGIRILGENDGVIQELPPVDNENTKKVLKEVLGIERVGEPTLWFYALSNDNY